VNIVSCAQGTEEWRLERLGRLTASRIGEATARIKSGWGASRANLMGELIAERLTGMPTVGYTNAAMKWGSEVEPLARAAYVFFTDREVVEVGHVLHPTIAEAGASPDGLVGDDGLIEIKCPNTATHIDTLLGKAIDGAYVAQVQFQLACCVGRRWCDWISFDPRLPASMCLFVKRIARDDKLITALEEDARLFLTELADKLAALIAKYPSFTPPDTAKDDVAISIRN
jgi:predicted phage-related endonuclease